MVKTITGELDSAAMEITAVTGTTVVTETTVATEIMEEEATVTTEGATEMLI